ncbi:MAG: MBL fold metallo-hydrolase, partial [Firmicutes bacterium]|nr:MBL fold metallo-hydrolase [Bacillota bacterium]
RGGHAVQVTIIGSGSPRWSTERSAPSVLVEHEGRYLLVDCGDGTVQQLLRLGVAPQQVTAVLFTHLHADHALGFGQLLIGGWIHGRRELFVAGPPGTARHYRTYCEVLFPEDIEYRIALGRSRRGLLEDVVVQELPLQLPTPFAVGPFEVRYQEVPHSIVTVAYRISAGPGDDLVISGDTAYSPKLAEFSQDTSLLIHEAVLVPSAAHAPGLRRADDSTWDSLRPHHSTAQEAGNIAQRARSKGLVLTHLLPGADLVRAHLDAQAEYRGPVWMAEDLRQWRFVGGQAIGPIRGRSGGPRAGT